MRLLFVCIFCRDHLYHHKTEEKEDTDEDEPEDLEAEVCKSTEEMYTKN